NEPICDAARSILDGHIILSRQLGSAGHYPAIDILNSVSRLASQLATGDQKTAARKIREAMAAYQRAEDLINLGAYTSGANPRLDAVIQGRPLLLGFLTQEPDTKALPAETLEGLRQVASVI